MISNSFSNKGIKVIKLNEDEQILYDYEEMIKDMNVQEFVDFTDNYDVNKSYEAGKVFIRRKYIQKYYIEWVHSEYLKMLKDGVNKDKKIDTEISDWLNIKIKNIKMDNIRGAYRRIESLSYILWYTQIKFKQQYTCTVFSIKKTGSKKTTNYAYLYSTIQSSKYLAKTGTDSYNTFVDHNFFCTGPNLVSSDGEYRGRFTNIYTIENLKLHFADMWDEVGDYLSNRSKTIFTQNIYLATGINNKHISNFKDNIESNRFAMSLYIISWISQGFITHLGLQNNHVDSTYKINLFDSGDYRFIEHIIEIYSIETLKRFYWESGYISIPIHLPVKIPHLRYNPTMGQKIIPLGKKELENVGNITYKTWREYYISGLVSNLFINLICPGVPILHDWFYINNIDKHLFNNPEMYDKMILSDKHKKINSDSRSDKYHINDELIMSDKSIIIITEYVGRTINNIPSSLKSKEYNKSIGSMFSLPDVFFKYIFDITYSLLCMNSKLNIIHGDLHLNNTTIHHAYKTYIHKNEGNNEYDRNVVYILDKEVFIFNSGIIGTVIDFSRAFIIPDREEYLQLKEIQSKKILDYYNLLFPEFMKLFDEKLKKKINSDFKHVYKVFSAIDMYVHTNRLINFTNMHDNLNTHEKVLSLIMKINKISKHYLLDTMEKIIKEDVDINSIKYPNHDILLNCFNKYSISLKHLKKKNIHIDDIYFYKNEIRYSLSSFDTLPPRFKFFKLKKPDSYETATIQYKIPILDNLKKYYNVKGLQYKK